MNDNIDEKMVLQFIKNNPDFLSNNAKQLFPTLHDDNVVDFQSALVEKLRGRVQSETAKKDAILNVGRENFYTFTRIQHCILSVLQAQSLMELLDVIYNDWANTLGLDLLVLAIETDMQDTLPLKGMTFLSKGQVKRWLNGRDVYVQADGTLKPVFSGASEFINSYALVNLPLGEGRPDALIGFATKDKNTFTSEDGTENIVFLCKSLGYIVRKWLVSS